MLGTSSVVLDVMDPDAAAAAIAQLFAAPAALLVNNAAANRPRAALDVDPASWDAVHDANVRGLFFVSQVVAREWVARGVRGSIVNVGSQAGRVAIDDRAAYGSSKAAVEQLTRNLAFEWAARGVRVNAIAPTFIRTELTASTLTGARADELVSRIPLGRLGEPEEVVGAVAFLLGDAASLITGHTLVIDGGYTIH